MTRCAWVALSNSFGSLLIVSLFSLSIPFLRHLRPSSIVSSFNVYSLSFIHSLSCVRACASISLSVLAEMPLASAGAGASASVSAKLRAALLWFPLLLLFTPTSHSNPVLPLPSQSKASNTQYPIPKPPPPLPLPVQRYPRPPARGTIYAHVYLLTYLLTSACIRN